LGGARKGDVQKTMFIFTTKDEFVEVKGVFSESTTETKLLGGVKGTGGENNRKKRMEWVVICFIYISNNRKRLLIYNPVRT